MLETEIDTTIDRSEMIIKPMARYIGAEVFGYRGLDNEVQNKCLKEAFLKHSVLVIRGINFTPKEQLEFSKLFGEPIIHPTAPKEKFLAEVPELVIIEPVEKTGFYVEGERWHSDLSCAEIPPSASLLHARTLPSIGGDTMFASGYAIYNSLSKPLQNMLESMSAEHVGTTYANSYLHGGEVPKAIHPVVVMHPETGRKSIFVNPIFTSRILDLHKDESDAILNVIYKKLDLAEFQCRVRWSPGTLTMWDNRCAFHRALNDYLPEKRIMHRATLAGTKPVLQSAQS